MNRLFNARKKSVAMGVALAFAGLLCLASFAQAAQRDYAIPAGVLPDTFDQRHNPASKDANYWMAEQPLTEDDTQYYMGPVRKKTTLPSTLAQQTRNGAKQPVAAAAPHAPAVVSNRGLSAVTPLSSASTLAPSSASPAATTPASSLLAPAAPAAQAGMLPVAKQADPVTEDMEMMDNAGAADSAVSGLVPHSQAKNAAGSNPSLELPSGNNLGQGAGGGSPISLP